MHATYASRAVVQPDRSVWECGRIAQGVQLIHCLDHHHRMYVCYCVSDCVDVYSLVSVNILRVFFTHGVADSYARQDSWKKMVFGH